MKRSFGMLIGAIALAGLGMLAACSGSQLVTAASSVPGQLFCSIQTAGGGQMLAAIVNADVALASPTAAPIAVVATGQTVTYVNGICAAAAASVPNAVSGAPVSPPSATATVATLAVSVTKATTTAPASTPTTSTSG